MQYTIYTYSTLGYVTQNDVVHHKPVPWGCNIGRCSTTSIPLIFSGSQHTTMQYTLYPFEYHGRQKRTIKQGFPVPLSYTDALPEPLNTYINFVFSSTAAFYHCSTIDDKNVPENSTCLVPQQRIAEIRLVCRNPLLHNSMQ